MSGNNSNKVSPTLFAVEALAKVTGEDYLEGPAGVDAAEAAEEREVAADVSARIRHILLTLGIALLGVEIDNIRNNGPKTLCALDIVYCKCITWTTSALGVIKVELT
jgi:hypothetical protein